MEKKSIEDSQQFTERSLKSAYESAEESTQLTGAQWIVTYEETQCTIDYYKSPSVGSGFLFQWGGGTFVDSSIPFYKRIPTDEERDRISDCGTTIRIQKEESVR